MSKTTIKTERNIRPVIYRDFFTDFSMLFEQYTPATELMITNSVKEVISNHEPRANLINVISSPAQGGTAITVTVVFSIINNPDPVQLSVILERMR